MCQLNMYFIDKAVASEAVAELMSSAGMLPESERIENHIDDRRLDSFNAYICAGMRCNCNSFIAKLQDGRYENFDEMKSKSIAEKIAQLQEIRALMLSKGYKKRLRAFNKELDEIYDITHQMSSYIGEIEEKLTDEVMNRKDISDEQKSKLMNESVYPKINKIMEEDYNRPEVIEARKRHQDFIESNRIMWESSMYTIKKRKIKKVLMQKLTQSRAIELSGYEPEQKEEDNEEYYLEMPSDNIDDAIEAAKHSKTFVQYEEEFLEIKTFIDSVLQQSKKMHILSYWQSGEDNKIIDEQIICLSELSIDTLLKLKYDTLLTIVAK